MKAISLFSGAGGLDLGFTQAGWNIVMANDNNSNAYLTYKSNIISHKQNIEYIISDIEHVYDVANKNKNIDLVFGEPPYVKYFEKQLTSLEKPHNETLSSFVDIVQIVEPKFFVCENNQHFYPKTWIDVENTFMQVLHKKYTIVAFLLNAADFGIPHNRSSVFFVGVHKDIQNDLQMLFLKLRVALNAFMMKAPFLKDVLSFETMHGRAIDSPVVYAKTPKIKSSAYYSLLFNGSGRLLSPESVCPPLMHGMGGNKVPIIDEGLMYKNKDSYVSEYFKELSHGGEVRVGNVPSFVRRLNILELLKIQGFPDSFTMCGPLDDQYRQISRATSPFLGFVIAKSLQSLL